RLDAEQHLRYKPSERLGQALTEFRGELRQLRFESGANFAIVHWGWPPGGLDFSQKTVLPRISSPPTSQSRQATDLSRVRQPVLQILGKLLQDFQEFPQNLQPPVSNHCGYSDMGFYASGRDLTRETNSGISRRGRQFDPRERVQLRWATPRCTSFQ